MRKPLSTLFLTYGSISIRIEKGTGDRQTALRDAIRQCAAQPHQIMQADTWNAQADAKSRSDTRLDKPSISFPTWNTFQVLLARRVWAVWRLLTRLGLVHRFRLLSVCAPTLPRPRSPTGAGHGRTQLRVQMRWTTRPPFRVYVQLLPRHLRITSLLFVAPMATVIDSVTDKVRGRPRHHPRAGFRPADGRRLSPRSLRLSAPGASSIRRRPTVAPSAAAEFADGQTTADDLGQVAIPLPRL